MVKNSSRLLTEFQSLKDEEKEIVRAASLFWGTVTREEIIACLNLKDVENHLKASWVMSRAWPVFSALESRSFLQRDGACNTVLSHPLTLEIASGPHAQHWFSAARTVLEKRTQMYWMPALPSLLRLAVYEGNGDKIKQLGEKNAQQSFRHDTRPVFVSDFFRDAEIGMPWLSTRPPSVQVEIFSDRMQRLFTTGEPPGGMAEMAAYFHTTLDNPDYFRAASQLVNYDILSLDFAGARQSARAILQEYPEASEVAEGSIAFLEGRGREAVAHFNAAITIIKKAEGRKKANLPAISGVLHILSLLSVEDAALLPTAKDALGFLQRSKAIPGSITSLEILILYQEGLSAQAATRAGVLPDTPDSKDAFSRALTTLAVHIVSPKVLASRHAEIKTCFHSLSGALCVLGAIYAEILKETAADPSPYEAFLAPLRRRGLRPFTRFLEGEDWERKLNALELLVNGPASAVPARPVSKRRVAYFVDTKTRAIQPVEQTEKGGKWTGRKVIALKRLVDRHPSIDYLTAQDQAVIRTIQTFNHGWGHSVYLSFDFDQAILALTGHPAVFSSRNTQQPVEVVTITPEVVVKETKDGFRIGLSPKPDMREVVLHEESPERWIVINFAPVREVVALVGEKEIAVPTGAKAKVMGILAAQNPRIRVRSLGTGLDEETVRADDAPVLQLTPEDNGLRARIAVRPFGPGGPAYPAGEGAQTVTFFSGSMRKRAHRNLDAEKARKLDLIDACPHLAEADDGSNLFIIDSLEESLELMMELQAFPGPHYVEWPEGKTLSVTLPLTAKSFRLSLQRSQDWFSVDGQLEVDEGVLLEFKDLLEHARAARGRFIKLEDGQFLALTHRLKKQLERLQAVAGVQKGSYRFHKFGIPAIEEFLGDAGRLDADDSWRKHVEQMRNAALHVPKIPHLLQADLREYQEEGYCWMMRLAQWGAGACLADDMGVGKTIQAIAVMLELARKGPCIVIAPTSVCPNWILELRRFAPALQASLFSTADGRKEMVDALGPMHVLVVSYTLLHMEADLLSEKKWAMAVLDEAQAIKNADTRRAQASVKLEAGFRLALTGTPIENYLEELWSLFNFVNPGLLGSKESFQKRFVASSSKEQAAESRQTLKALIKPFILRRTKAAVLSELPPRIEKTVSVVLSPEERSFYEALRQVAIERLASLGDGPSGQQKIHILAEITRLRRACCHTRLVQPDVSLESSKLNVFLDLVEELRRNSHRALVFSQFVGHLQVVREALDTSGIPYQYLDGQSPAASRERSISAFQNGEGDLFLISLKAGGLGLNLTAADFVFHLDPWWNPAVEDQATDRAHRIGQTRPVTIYRLIAQNTIEEKIIQLHQTKRDLAADLLSGAEMAASLSNEQLLELITG